MIRILIADDLSIQTIDKLNEIPEFEIIEKTKLSLKTLANEIKNVDAMVMSSTTLLPTAILKSAVNLKIIVATGREPNQVEFALASRKNIEVRHTPLSAVSAAGASTAEDHEREGLDVIAILKDFFNV